MSTITITLDGRDFDSISVDINLNKGKRKFTEQLPQPEMIIEATAKLFNLSIDELTGKNFTKENMPAQNIAMYMIRKLTPQSLRSVSEIFACDIASVKQAVFNGKNYIETHPELVSEIKSIIYKSNKYTEEN